MKTVSTYVPDLGVHDKNLEKLSSELHSFHSYPGRFAPEIPREIISSYSKPYDVILDNFCGVGTSLIQAVLQKRNAIGVDSHPLACLIAKVKSSPIEPAFLKKECFRILDILTELIIMLRKDNYELVTRSYHLPNFPNKEEWFHPFVLKELTVVYSIIKKVEEQDIKNFLLVCFSSILREVCNPTHYKFIADNMVPRKSQYCDVLNVFAKKLIKMIDTNENFYRVRPKDISSEVFCEDSRNLFMLKDSSIDLALTSPPYLNQLDYMKMHRLSFYWLEIPLDYSNEIGARAKRGRKKCVSDYYDDMKTCMREVYRVLKDDSYYVMIVGDCTKLNNKSIHIYQELVKIAQQVGFKFKGKVKKNQDGFFFRNHDKSNCEWIIFLQK
jgi:DNA modification methylase